MRKSRFLLSLIAATAIGLSVVGCESGDSGSIQDTTDLIQPINNGTSSLREYLLVGQRGLLTPSATLGTGQSAPSTTPTRTVFVGPTDDGVTNTPPQLYEVFGVSDTPRPNATLITPGNVESTTPVEPEDTLLDAADSAFQEIYPSPGGSYAIALGRAKGHQADPDDAITNSSIQIFSLELDPVDVTFPPVINFRPPADPVSNYFYTRNQGEFVSGAWSSNAQQFYVGMNNSIMTLAFDGTIGRVDFVQTAPFPAAPAGLNINNQPGTNNPVKIIVRPDNQFVYALDNANAQLVTYARNQRDGTLTQVGTTALPADPRGMTLDRSSRYLYVAGRGSEQLAGFRLAADGTVSPIDVFPDLGLGPVPFNIGDPLGDVAANPQTDALFLTTYLGVMQAYTIDPETGGLQASGGSGGPLGIARNAANIEVDPTGRFVFGAYEHDLDSFQPYNNPANGFPYNEGAVFANLDAATNATTPTQATPGLDTLGRIVFLAPIQDSLLFTGGVQVWRIQDSGQPRAESSVDASNPFGLQFFQKVVPIPASDTPPVP